MLIDDLYVTCTEDLFYEDLHVGKKGVEYLVLSYAKQSVIIRIEKGIDAIISSEDFRKHYSVNRGGGMS